MSSKLTIHWTENVQGILLRFRIQMILAAKITLQTESAHQTCNKKDAPMNVTHPFLVDRAASSSKVPGQAINTGTHRDSQGT